jgi:glycerate kinase
MKILVAMDSFKGSLAAVAACRAVRRGILEVQPDAEVVLRPIADGGEGTARAILDAAGGEWIEELVMGPLEDMRTPAGYAWLPDSGPAAVVEMAQASGLSLLEPDQFDPLRATTFGTGQLIRAAIARGAQRLWLGVGDSATVDGGVGAAMALGWRFEDVAGQQVGLGGAELQRIALIAHPKGFQLPPVEVLCDVDNPLCGERGAARVFGPQKGATPAQVELLEASLSHLSGQVFQHLEKEIRDLSGSGAAGGLAGGAVAFLGATLVPGIDTIMKIVGLEEELKSANWVFTGEGRFDQQSLSGKAVSGIVRLARLTRARVAVLAGSIELDTATAREAGIQAMHATRSEDMPLEDAIAGAEPLLVQAAACLMRKTALES